MTEENKAIAQAEFDPRVCLYWLTSVTLILIVTVAGIPLIIPWLVGGLYITRRYLSRMSCVLTPQNLLVNKGVLVRVEKTIPLDKITDLGLVQGPIMRHFGVHQLTIETAGQSAQGPLASLTGIVDVSAFRETVLRQRDKLRERPQGSGGPETGDSLSTEVGLLGEIRDILGRIESQLGKSG